MWCSYCWMPFTEIKWYFAFCYFLWFNSNHSWAAVDVNVQSINNNAIHFHCASFVSWLSELSMRNIQCKIPVDVNESMLISECYRIAFEFKVYAGIMNSVILQSLPCFPQLNCVCCFIQAVYFLYSSAEWKNVIEYGNDQIMKHYNRFSTIFL